MSERGRNVVAISGYVGSGKSAAVAVLSKALHNAPVLAFDDYEAHVQWPADMQAWMEDGADPSAIRVPKLRDDLVSLRDGRPIHRPVDGALVHPAGVILLEEPCGRERREIAGYIDLLVYIDVPEDVCVARIVQRALDMDVWRRRSTFAGLLHEDLARQLDAVAGWVEHYQKVRPMYVRGAAAVKRNADRIVDGTRPIDEVVREILDLVGERFPEFQ